MEEKIFELLKEMRQDMKDLKFDMKTMQNDMKQLKEGQQRLETEVKSIKEQTADLMEFRTEVKDKLDILTDVVQENCFEITHLKALKRIK